MPDARGGLADQEGPGLGQGGLSAQTPAEEEETEGGPGAGSTMWKSV